MKKTVYFLLALPLLVLLPALLLAQAAGDTIIVPPAIGPDAQLGDFLNLYSILEGAVIVILGYLHNWIPGLNMIPAKWFRIVLIGAVVGVIFAALGFANGIGTVFVFLQAVGFYSLILKPVAPSPPAKVVSLGKKAA
jgi:hypothetical protein